MSIKYIRKGRVTTGHYSGNVMYVRKGTVTTGGYSGGEYYEDTVGIEADAATLVELADNVDRLTEENTYGGLKIDFGFTSGKRVVTWEKHCYKQQMIEEIVPPEVFDSLGWKIHPGDILAYPTINKKSPSMKYVLIECIWVNNEGEEFITARPEWGPPEDLLIDLVAELCVYISTEQVKDQKYNKILEMQQRFLERKK